MILYENILNDIIKVLHIIVLLYIFENTKMINLAIFASGTGTNARKIIEHFEEHNQIKVALILTNKPKAKVLDIADEYKIPSVVVNRKDFFDTSTTIENLESFNIGFIVLAGFLWLIPQNLIEVYENKIINIHPSLLPKYGGKGMYGMNVHQAVVDNNEKETGITIHFVNEKFDDGKIIFQARCILDKKDAPNDVAKKVQFLEHKYFSDILEQTIIHTL